MLMVMRRGWKRSKPRRRGILKRPARRSDTSLAEDVPIFMVRTQFGAGARNIRGWSAWQWLRVFALAYGWMSFDTTRRWVREETASWKQCA